MCVCAFVYMWMGGGCTFLSDPLTLWSIPHATPPVHCVPSPQVCGWTDPGERVWPSVGMTHGRGDVCQCCHSHTTGGQPQCREVSRSEGGYTERSCVCV